MKTALYEHHLALGAKMVHFSGWEMPVYYSSIISEHHAVRNHVGIFDVSHMGKVNIRGPDAEKLLDYLSVNRIFGKKPLTAAYTVWCQKDGGSVDDLIVYKEDSENYFIVANAGNREKDLSHLQDAAKKFNVMIEDKYQDGILAVQGPKARSLITRLFPEASQIKPMHFAKVDRSDIEVIISGTGYTGSGGFELFAGKEAIVSLWETILNMGKAYDIMPVGLGARDTLRLEMGFPLYGHELSDTIAPTETVANWTVKFDQRAFIGKEALEELEREGNKRSQYGIILENKGIAREGYKVFQGEKQIGYVTSGTMSPSLQKAIAIIFVDRNLTLGENIDIEIRGKLHRAVVAPLPFWRNEK